MNKQKVLNFIIAVLIIVFIGLTALLLTIKATSNKPLEVNTDKGFATEPMAVKPEVVVVEPVVTEIVIVENETLPQNQDNQQTTSQPTQAPRPSNESLQRTTQTAHTVKKGDTVAHITTQQWGNAYLWPDLYDYNQWKSNNPDLIFPGEEVKIPNRLGRNNTYTVEEIASITQSYLKVYKLYQKQGAKAQNSKWYTLYSATRIMPNFLEDNADYIDKADIAMAKQRIAQARAMQ